MNNILIFGASGLLGSTLSITLSKNNNVTCTHNHHAFTQSKIRSIHCNVLNKKDLDHLILNSKPDIIINAAADTNVDRCESHRSECKLINTDFPKLLSAICNEQNIYLIHFSTDAFFDGSKNFYSEEDTPKPMNFYAESKLQAEQHIISNHDLYCIVRTNLFGWNYQNKLSISEWFLRELRANKQITGFNDVFFTPILTMTLSDIVEQIISNKLKGIYHAGSPTSISKYDFGIQLAKLFYLNEKLIKPISVEDVKLSAKRSKNMSLDSTKLHRSLPGLSYTLQSDLQLFKKLEDTGWVNKFKSSLL